MEEEVYCKCESCDIELYESDFKHNKGDGVTDTWVCDDCHNYYKHDIGRTG